ncbi:unnamed protein product [Discula destructiva]
MMSLFANITAGLATLSLIGTAQGATPTTSSIPSSTDAASYLHDIAATPSWATGKYATSLATALYSVETSFGMRDDYHTIVNAIWSAASKDGGDEVLASMSASYWNWAGITTNGWYTSNVPKALQTEVLNYDSAYGSAYSSVEAKATATGNAAAPRCTAMAVAGVAAFGAAVAGIM